MALDTGIYDVRFLQGGVVRGTGTWAIDTTLADTAVSGAFNVAKGTAKQLIEDNPDSIVVLLLKIQEAEATMEDYNTVNDLLAGDPVEADFTNYARITGISGTVVVDDTGDEVTVDIPDQTWTAAGGATNNTVEKLVVAVQTGGDDTTLIPLTHHNFKITTDGSSILAKFNSTGIFRVQ